MLLHMLMIIMILIIMILIIMLYPLLPDLWSQTFSLLTSLEAGARLHRASQAMLGHAC